MIHEFPWKWSLSGLEPPKDGAPTVFSCFSCGGGSSMGYKLAGFDVVGCCEIDPGIIEQYKENLHPRHPFNMDVREFSKLGEYPDEVRDVDVLDGSPPCSSFTTNGVREKGWGREKVFHEGQAKQVLDDLFFAFLDVVEALRPKVVVAENVEGLVMGNARGYVNLIVKRFMELGYSVQLFLLDGRDMGVPQSRRRTFFLANRCGYPKMSLDFHEEPITFGEVRTEEPGLEVTGKTREYLDEYRDGESDLRYACERLTGKKNQFGTAVMSDAQVSRTITSTVRLIRAHDRTWYSDMDIVNCSTFPQDYRFVPCSRQNIEFTCGMSVPPVMMAHVASEVRRQWLLR